MSYFFFGVCSLLGIIIRHIIANFSKSKYIPLNDISYFNETEEGVRVSSYLYWYMIYIIMNMIPLILLYELALPFLDFVTANMNSTFVAAFVSVVTVLSFINYLPILRRSGIFALGILVLILLLASVGFSIYCAYLHPYSEENPYTMYIKHEYSPDENLSNITLRIIHPYTLSIEEIFKKYYTENKFSEMLYCVDRSQCTLRRASIPNVPSLEVTVSNQKIDLESNEKRVKLLIKSPASYIHRLRFNSYNITNLTINDNPIDHIDYNDFYYFLNTTQWYIDATLKYSSDTLKFDLYSYYDTPDYSPDLNYLIQITDQSEKRPNWVSYIGSATGLISVYHRYSFE